MPAGGSKKETSGLEKKKIRFLAGGRETREKKFPTLVAAVWARNKYLISTEIKSGRLKTKHNIKGYLRDI